MLSVAVNLKSYDKNCHLRQMAVFVPLCYDGFVKHIVHNLSGKALLMVVVIR